MEQFKGDRAFSMFMIPNIVKGYLHQLLVKIPNKENAYTYLGNHQVSVDKGVPAFGPWLGENPVFVAGIINGTRAGKSYNWTEMKALYNVLTNASLLLPPSSSNTTNHAVEGRGLVTYLGTYAALAKTSSTIANATIKATFDAQMQKLQANMNKLLCPDPSSCFKITDTITIQALAQFITSYLAAASIDFLDKNNYGLIVSRPVKELVFGYTMTKLPLPPKYPNGIPVPGVLVNHGSEADAGNKSKIVSLYTCDSTLGAANTWAGWYNPNTKSKIILILAKLLRNILLRLYRPQIMKKISQN